MLGIRPNTNQAGTGQEQKFPGPNGRDHRKDHRAVELMIILVISADGKDTINYCRLLGHIPSSAPQLTQLLKTCRL